MVSIQVSERVTPGVGYLLIILYHWTEIDADVSFRPSYLYYYQMYNLLGRLHMLYILAGPDRVMPSPDAGKVAKPMILRSSD